MKNGYSIICIFLFLCVFLPACGASPTTSIIPTATNPIAQQTEQSTQTQSAIPTPTKIITPGLKPEDWQNWPVIPAVTEKAKEIYLKGMSMGNNPHAFSKIGDCQNLRNAFLGFFDQPGQYSLKGDYASLADTIENFKGYFNRDGEAAQFGFTAASPLSPLVANQNDCQPDENPMECELRITHPTFVLISLEFAFKGRTDEIYERYMRQIIEYVISQGAVPILSTKADNMEKDNSINYTTAKLAAEYDLPLWNFWAAAQTLPDKGMDMYRNDGFHISVLAWEKRSYTFLQTLDRLWKDLKDIK